MNLDQGENYSQEDHNFQDNEAQFDRQNNESVPTDHSISNNAEPDFGNDLSSEEFDNSELGNENLGNNEFDKDEFDTDKADNEFETQDEDEIGNEELDNERLGDLDDDNKTDFNQSL